MLRLPLTFQDGTRTSPPPTSADEVRARLLALLKGDLDFHGEHEEAIHRIHPFPAKFPPALPKLFIEQLTRPGDRVLDPMMGSGTTVVEAAYAGRIALGGDIDPLALEIARAKCHPIPPHHLEHAVRQALQRAESLYRDGQALQQAFESRFDHETRRFLDYWFLKSTQRELLALQQSVEQEENPDVKTWLRVVFSGIIIAKGGSVALARDLSHTRPHRVHKTSRSALAAFRERGFRMVQRLSRTQFAPSLRCLLWQGDAQRLPLPSNHVRLIVTSPPYASNAIDYMRAHKFTLVWWGYPIDTLSQLRREYIGGEAIQGVLMEPLPSEAQEAVRRIATRDAKKGKVLHRYFSEMRRVLLEMVRVLEPGGCAVLVVGDSTMRGVSTRTPEALAAIGRQIGLEWVYTSIRRLDRDRRMMPTRRQPGASQIEQRMHHEYVLGFIKPEGKG